MDCRKVSCGEVCVWGFGMGLDDIRSDGSCIR